MADRRILLVLDADASRRRGLAELLEPTPHALVMSQDLDDALLRTRECRPDAILLAGPGVWDLDTVLASLSQAALTLRIPLFLMEQSPGPASAVVDGVLHLPLDKAGLTSVLREVAARNAAAFAARAMDMDLDMFAHVTDGTATSPSLPVVDEPTQLGSADDVLDVLAQMGGAVSSDAPVAHGPPDPEETTNVGVEPQGLPEVLAASPAASAAEEVFASGPDAARPAPAEGPLDTDPHTAMPPPAPLTLLTAPPPSGAAPGRPMAGVLKLDSAPLPATVSPAQPGQTPDGVGVLDCTPLGPDAARRLCELYNQLDGASHQQVLGVPDDASAAEMAQAFLALARLFHPDAVMAAGAPLKEVARRVFNRISHAYAALVVLPPDTTSRTGPSPRLRPAQPPASEHIMAAAPWPTPPATPPPPPPPPQASAPSSAPPGSDRAPTVPELSAHATEPADVVGVSENVVEAVEVDAAEMVGAADDEAEAEDMDEVDVVEVTTTTTAANVPPPARSNGAAAPPPVPSLGLRPPTRDTAVERPSVILDMSPEPQAAPGAARRRVLRSGEAGGGHTQSAAQATSLRRHVCGPGSGSTTAHHADRRRRHHPWRPQVCPSCRTVAQPAGPQWRTAQPDLCPGV